MTAPDSPARALHDILAEVNSQLVETKVSHAQTAWGEVAGAAVPTADFAVFHAEVMVLLSETQEGLRGLPPATQERYRRYVPAWWNALVLPRTDWARVQEIIDAPALDMLASLAELVETRAGFLGKTNPQAPEILKRGILHIHNTVEDETELPDPVRDQILADLRHVLWLLDHVEAFGVDHAVTAAETATGKVVVAATKSRSRKLKAIAAGLVTALTVIAGGTGHVNEIVANVEHTFGLSAEATPGQDKDPVKVTVKQVFELCAPPQELGPGLSAPRQEGDVIDGEIVEDAVGGE